MREGREPDIAWFAELAEIVREHQLPLEAFEHLLSAFRQDVTQRRYATFDEVLDYCRRSANPVGRLILALYAVRDAQASSVVGFDLLEPSVDQFRAGRKDRLREGPRVFSPG